MSREIDIDWIVHALDCRAKGPGNLRECYDQNFPEASMPGFEKRLCEDCPYYYDFNGCDMEQILLDALAWVQQTRKEMKKAAHS